MKKSAIALSLWLMSSIGFSNILSYSDLTKEHLNNDEYGLSYLAEDEPRAVLKLDIPPLNIFFQNHKDLFLEFSKDEDFSQIESREKIKSFNTIVRSRLDGDYYYRVSSGDNKIVGSAKRANLVNYYGDLDQDGLLNGWEMHNYHGYDLKRFAGVNYRKKDIIVVLGKMGSQRFPNDIVLNRVIKAFGDSPVKNPDGSTGIRIIFVKQEQKNYPNYSHNYWDLERGKIRKFFVSDQNLSNIFFVGFIGRANIDRSDISANRPDYRLSGVAFVGTRDFAVFPNVFYPRRVKIDGEAAASFEYSKVIMHELGHNLGLNHGGGDAIDGKPNYPSIMNTVYMDSSVYLRLDGKVVGPKMDFTRIELPRMNTRNLDESQPFRTYYYYMSWVCPLKANESLTSSSNLHSPERLARGQIDWNCDGRIQAGRSSDIATGLAQINKTNQIPASIRSYNDWANISIRNAILNTNNTASFLLGSEGSSINKLVKCGFNLGKSR